MMDVDVVSTVNARTLESTSHEGGVASPLDEEHTTQPPASPARIEMAAYDAAVVAKKAGNTHFGAGRLREALAAYDEALGHFGMKAGDGVQREEKVKLLSNRAECCLRLEEWLNAMGTASQALDLDPAHAKSLLRRAKARVGIGTHESLEAARTDLKKLSTIERSAKAGHLQLLEEIHAKLKPIREVESRPFQEGFTSAVRVDDEKPDAVLDVPGKHASVAAALASRPPNAKWVEIRIAAGDFPECVQLRSAESQRLSIVGAGRALTQLQSVEMGGHAPQLEGVSVSGGIVVEDETEEAVIRKCAVSSPGGCALMKKGGDLVVENCHVTQCADGILNQSGSLHVGQCLIEDCSDDGIFSNSRFSIEDSTIRDVGSHGIKSRGGIDHRGKNNIQG